MINNLTLFNSASQSQLFGNPAHLSTIKTQSSQEQQSKLFQSSMVSSTISTKPNFSIRQSNKMDLRSSLDLRMIPQTAKIQKLNQRGTLNDFFNHNLKSKYEKNLFAGEGSRKNSRRNISKDQEFRPYVEERDSMNKLISVDYKPVRSFQLPSVQQTKKFLERFKKKKTKGVNMDVNYQISDQFNLQTTKLNLGQGDQCSISFENQTLITDRSKSLHGLDSININLLENNKNFVNNRNLDKLQYSKNPMFKSRNSSLPMNQSDTNTTQLNFSLFKVRQLQADSYSKHQASNLKNSFIQQSTVQSSPDELHLTQQQQSNREQHKNRMIMIDSYQKLKQKLYQSQANIRAIPYPNLKTYASESFLNNQQPAQQNNLFGVDNYMSHNQLPVLNYKYQIPQKQRNFRKNQLQVKSKLEEENEKIRNIMNAKPEEGNKIKENKELKTVFSPQNNLKKLTTDELLQLTQTKMVSYLEKQEPKILENSKQKLMKKDNQLQDLHKREKAIGLSHIPLERPVDGRSQIKGIIMDIRSNISKLNY
ncbi:UNKNOWN [Stylonychia lemnae]|uniref:Uncharacterized protein n=1 Tax=Stylonychia lemnae TaxID=5949 RepID=A0A078AR28_STYLE|nr:UNKNOWN [Stylonychia lemnae]|eukprot:CDW84674.1 UNKNOWN [Stylonychia lemnae]